jgi:hypothetical protein
MVQGVTKIMTTAKDAHGLPLLQKCTSIPIHQVHLKINNILFTHHITLNQSEMHYEMTRTTAQYTLTKPIQTN